MMKKVGLWSDVQGIIGNKEWQRPTEKWITNSKGDRMKINYFVLLCQNTMAGKNENGYFPQEPVTVYLPQGEAGRRVFKQLTAGRRVIVKGPLQAKPRSSSNDNIFANLEIQAQEIEFLDRPLNRVIRSFTQEVAENSNIFVEMFAKIRENVLDIESFTKEFSDRLERFAVQKYHDGRIILDEEGVPKKNN
jgi:hypothetical protein